MYTDNLTIFTNRLQIYFVVVNVVVFLICLQSWKKNSWSISCNVSYQIAMFTAEIELRQVIIQLKADIF